MMLQMKYQRERADLEVSAPMVGAPDRKDREVVGSMETESTMFETLLDSAAFPSRLLSIWIFGSTHWSPNRRNQMVLRRLTISNKTCTGFTDSHPRSGKVVSQTLIVFYQTP